MVKDQKLPEKTDNFEVENMPVLTKSVRGDGCMGDTKLPENLTRVKRGVKVDGSMVNREIENETRHSEDSTIKDLSLDSEKLDILNQFVATFEPPDIVDCNDSKYLYDYTDELNQSRILNALIDQKFGPYDDTVVKLEVNTNENDDINDTSTSIDSINQNIKGMQTRLPCHLLSNIDIHTLPTRSDSLLKRSCDLENLSDDSLVIRNCQAQPRLSLGNSLSQCDPTMEGDRKLGTRLIIKKTLCQTQPQAIMDDKTSCQTESQPTDKELPHHRKTPINPILIGPLIQLILNGRG